MDTIVAESWVTLNARLLRKNVIVLSLEITNNLAEAIPGSATRICILSPISSYLASLSI